MTAPLCGSVSMPPLAIDATRCSTSGGICAASAKAMKSLAIAARAIDMPPDAEPVMPASEVTVIASFTSGLGMAFSVSKTPSSRMWRNRNRPRNPAVAGAGCSHALDCLPRARSTA